MKIRFLLIALAAASRLTCHAGISEPDNIIYGTILLGTNALTAHSTNVFVEARQTTNGPAIASYQMGSLPTAGNYYSLRVSLEDSPPANPVASQTGNILYVTVRDQTGVRTQQVYTVADRGHATRMDFGNPQPDGDGDGLPDAWELLYYGSLGVGANFVAANGQTALANYIAGTDPNNTNSVLEVNIQLNASQQRIVSFYGIAAAGTGYTGLSRIYDLQYTTNFASVWLDIPGMNNVTGNNQTVNYLETGTNSSAFYRVKVRLQ